MAQPEPRLEPIKHLWRDLKIAVQQRSPSNLTKLERICREEWEKLPKYRCAKLVALYPRRLEAVISAKGASTKYLCKCDISVILFVIHFGKKTQKTVFALSLWDIVCRWMRNKNYLIRFRIRL